MARAHSPRRRCGSVLGGADAALAVDTNDPFNVNYNGDIDIDGITPATSPASDAVSAPSQHTLKRRATLTLSPPLYSPTGADAPATPLRCATPTLRDAAPSRGAEFEWALYVARVDLMCRLYARFADQTTPSEWRAIVAASVREAERAACRDAVLSLFRVHTAFYMPRTHQLWLSDVALLQECTFAHACRHADEPATSSAAGQELGAFPPSIASLFARIHAHALACAPGCEHCERACLLHDITPVLAAPSLARPVPPAARTPRRAPGATKRPRLACWCGAATPRTSRAQMWRYELAYVSAPHFNVRRTVDAESRPAESRPAER